jgi:hypothetical protein
MKMYNCIVYVLTIAGGLVVTISCGTEDPSSDPAVRSAEQRLMTEMERTKWYAPALRALRIAISEHQDRTGEWPKSPEDLQAHELAFRYPEGRTSREETLTADEYTFELRSVEGEYATYDIVIRGVDTPGQEIGSDERDDE